MLIPIRASLPFTGDDFFSAYHLARSFGAWDRSDMQIIMHPACSDRGWPDRACANHAKIAPYVLDRPLETANSTLFTSEAGPRVCFRNLYTGMRELGTSYPSKNIMPQFIQEFRKTAGLPATSTPSRQRITVFLKEGRRIFLNNDALAEYLRQRFDVEVDLMDPSKLSISEQLAYLQDTTGTQTATDDACISPAPTDPGVYSPGLALWRDQLRTVLLEQGCEHGGR